MMKRIVITTTSFGKYDKEVLNPLKENGFEIKLNPHGRKLNKEEVVQLCKDAIGIIAGTETLDTEVIEKLINLKVISRCGAGMDNVDLKSAEELGIKVYNTPDAPTVAVAELTIALMLALVRKIPVMDREIRDGVWKKRMGNLLSGKQVGIIGFGRIGRKVAEMLKALGANPIYYDPAIMQDKACGCKKYSECRELLKMSDIITLHLSYSKGDCNFFGKEEFSLMKQGAFLVNCSRGGIVDENALYSALKEGKVAGAAIDVFEQEPYNGPLKELDSVILTPHIGSYAKEARVKMEIEAVENLLTGLKET